MLWNDEIVIESGYRVTVNSPVTITYNQGLTMRGTATLTAKGDINVSDNPPARLKISGGSIIANGGTFIAGGQNGQNIVANIIASSIKLGGSPISVTGNLNAKGAVTISASSTVNGAIQGGSVSIEADAKVTNGISSTGPINLASRVNVTGAITGTTIVTASAVVIAGSITASTSLLIESASKVTGNLTAPSIQLKSTDLVVTGDVKASQTLVVENKATIKGDVEGGNVILGDSDAAITGNALVDHITLGYHGRVQQTITCKAYTPANPCSCVTNNSGWPAGSVNGPKCGPGTPTGPHHFQIDHPGTALTCAPQAVTVTACADAACSAKYTGGANVTVSPGGMATPIGNSGVATASRAPVHGRHGHPEPDQRARRHGRAGVQAAARTIDNSCNMAFAATGLMLTPTNHISGTQPSFGISAVQASGDQQACVALFANKNKDLTLACGYSNPASGTLPVFVKGTGGFIAWRRITAVLAVPWGRGVNLAFNGQGVATAVMSYADVGKVNLKATYTGSSASGDTGLSMTGNADVIVVPDAFSVVAIANPQRAGAPVTVSMSALNSAGAVTPNFGNEKPAETALPTLAAGQADGDRN